ncbi:MAG: hypothetical protein ACTHOF_01905 [Flavisolibacter sp.]|jgi:hypothetical protein
MKSFLFFCLVFFFVSCSDGTTTTTTTDSNGSSNAVTPLENVNGNIPDTINSVTPGTVKKGIDSTYAKDSTARDSTKK